LPSGDLDHTGRRSGRCRGEPGSSAYLFVVGKPWRRGDGDRRLESSRPDQYQPVYALSGARGLLAQVAEIDEHHRLDALERWARAFDEISRESDAHYSARSFVRWVRLETTARRDGEAPQMERITEPVSLGAPRSGLQRIGRDA